MDETNKRKTFEKWFDDTGKGTERDKNGNYKFMTAYTAWSNWSEGWEAAMRHHALGQK